MDKAIEILLKVIKVSTENLQYIAENTTGTNGMLLNSVIDTLKAQTLVIKTISCKLDEETAKKNRALDFICIKNLSYEFTNKKIIKQAVNCYRLFSFINKRLFQVVKQFRYIHLPTSLQCSNSRFQTVQTL